MKFDLRERASQFAIEIVHLVRRFPKDTVGLIIGKQLLRAGTSIGANLEEADAASSRRDFFHKISLSRKEAKETCYWLNLSKKSGLFEENNCSLAEKLLQESDELTRILSSIAQKENKNVPQAHIV